MSTRLSDFLELLRQVVGETACSLHLDRVLPISWIEPYTTGCYAHPIFAQASCALGVALCLYGLAGALALATHARRHRVSSS